MERTLPQRILRRLGNWWARTRPWRTRLRQDGPSSKRVQAWVAVAGLLSGLVFGVWSLLQANSDAGDKDEFSVLRLSAEHSRSIELQKRDETSGRRHTSKEQATVLHLYLSNNTDDLKVFQKIKVVTKLYIEVTECIRGTGGPVRITDGYDVSLPGPGEHTVEPILYQLPSRAAEGMEITLGSRMEAEGVYELEVFLHNGSEYQSVGTVIVSSPPDVKDVYPLDLDLLPIGDRPDPGCVRELDQKLKDLFSRDVPVAKSVRTLQQGVHSTAEQLEGDGQVLP
ncbi:hypothetical protein AMK26_20680 [Streptomyces sp. CB03234]|nr:hypothetical protein AMK26_20680 [Streptomyces sp. CB03234]